MYCAGTAASSVPCPARPVSPGHSRARCCTPSSPHLPPGEYLDAFDRILGTSAQAEAMRAFGRRAAAVDATVLITGETGTGKGVLARAIHDSSARARAALVAVNCAGVPASLFESEFFGHVRGAFTGAVHAHRGLFEQADRGTLFLDEIGELPLNMQAKLLTVLEDGQLRKVGSERTSQFDARLIAATGVDLEIAVAELRFRSDLYHRLHILQCRLPPLRERRDDVAVLAQHFLTFFARKYGRTTPCMAPDTLAALQAHDWPGNVRELAHTIEAAIVAAGNGRIRWKPLSRPPITPTTPTQLAKPAGRYCFSGPPDQEQALIRDALARHNGNRTRAARMLGMARNTLLGKMKRLAAKAHNGDAQERDG
ncbi:MAG: sigma-54 interaction domain-containing protein [Longimicrobiales bacterium]